MLVSIADKPIEDRMTPQDINANFIADLYGETYLAEDQLSPRRLAVSALFPGLIVGAMAAAAFIV